MRVLVALAIVLPLVAHADDKAKAIELFDEGQKQMKAGNFERACDAFRESHALKPDSGTRGSLARCYEKLGKIASAWKLWVDLTTTAPERLRPDAAANAAKLEPRLPRYVIKTSTASTSKFQLAIDGLEVTWTADTAVPIDPGPHVFEATATGHVPFRREVTSVEGKTEEIVVQLGPEPKLVDPPPAPVIVEPTPSSSTGRKVGIALIGVGGALVIGGGVLGVIAKGRYDDAEDICGGDIDACDPARTGDAQDKVDSARSAATLSTVSFIAGGAALVGGVILFVRSPKSKPRVSLVPTGNGVAITGGF